MRRGIEEVVGLIATIVMSVVSNFCVRPLKKGLPIHHIYTSEIMNWIFELDWSYWIVRSTQNKKLIL